jgi:hypothetical protein
MRCWLTAERGYLLDPLANPNRSALPYRPESAA